MDIVKLNSIGINELAWHILAGMLFIDNVAITALTPFPSPKALAEGICMGKGLANSVHIGINLLKSKTLYIRSKIP